MTKLIELLNEYDKYRGEKRRVYGWTKYKVELDVNLIISKKYEFIKWLVENDKIDFENMEGHGRLIGYLTDNMEKPTRDKVKEELVIMLLSISNSPIEDLLLYLK